MKSRHSFAKNRFLRKTQRCPVLRDQITKVIRLMCLFYCPRDYIASARTRVDDVYQRHSIGAFIARRKFTRGRLRQFVTSRDNFMTVSRAILLVHPIRPINLIAQRR